LPCHSLMQQPTARGRQESLQLSAKLRTQYIFQPIAVESLVSIHKSARQFLAKLGRKISARSGDDRSRKQFFVSAYFNFIASFQ